LRLIAACSVPVRRRRFTLILVPTHAPVLWQRYCSCDQTKMAAVKHALQTGAINAP
jgi:hypothetical protein